MCRTRGAGRSTRPTRPLPGSTRASCWPTGTTRSGTGCTCSGRITSTRRSRAPGSMPGWCTGRCRPPAAPRAAHPPGLSGPAPVRPRPSPGTPPRYSARMRTAFTDLVGAPHPIAGFNRSPGVVAAVTNAGGLGVLAASAYTPEELDAQLTWIEDQVSGRPYGVDLLLPEKFVPGDPDDLIASLRAQ